MPGSEEFVIDVSANFHDNASKGSEDVDKKLSGAAKSAKDYSQAIDKASQKIANLKDKQSSLTNQIAKAEAKYSSAKGKADTYRNGVKTLSDHLGKLTSEHKSVTSAIQKVESKLQQSTAEAKSNRTQADKLASTLQQLKQKEIELTQGISTTSDQLKTASQNQKTYADAVKGSRQELEKLRKENKLVKSELISETALKTGSTLQSAGKGMSKAGRKLMLGVTTPLLAAGTASFNYSKNFENSSAKVSTIADTSVRSMEELDAGILALSQETGQDASALNESLYQAISATGNTADALSYVKQASKAAIGGFTDTATAIDGLTTIMNSYGMQGEADMKKVSDEMLMAQNYGKTTFGELAVSMGQVVPIAAQLDIGTDTLMATMATLTKNGIRTNQAVTGLKAALSNVIKPSTEASEAAAALGIDFSAAALQAKGLPGFLEDVKQALANASPQYAALSDRSAEVAAQMSAMEGAGKKSSDAYKDLSQEQKTLKKQMEILASAADSPIAGFSELFGSVEGLNSMMVLTSETGSKDMIGAMEAMQNSAGATETAYNKMMDTKGNELEISLNKLKIAGIDAGNALAPAIVEIADSVAGLTQQFTALDPKVQRNIIKFLAISAAAGPVLKIFGGLTSGIGKTVSLFGKLAGSSAKAAGGAAGLTKGLGSAASGVAKLGGLAGKLPGILGLVATGLTITGVAMHEFHKKCLEEDLEEHFGDISLSMEEVEDIVKRLTTNEWTIDIDTVIENKEKVDSIKENLNSIITELEKTNWKVSIGLELTEEETSGYRESVDNFLSQAKEYAEQQHYTATLAIDTILTDNPAAKENATEVSDAYYTGLNKELSDLGSELANLVNDAFTDNILTPDEVDKIDEVQKKILEKTQELEQAKSELRLQSLAADAMRGGLDSESFSNLVSKMSEEITARKISTDNSKIESLAGLQAQLTKGEITQEEFNNLATPIRLGASKEMGNLTLNTLDIGLDTLTANYSKEIAAVQGEFESTFGQSMQDAMGSENWFLRKSEETAADSYFSETPRMERILVGIQNMPQHPIGRLLHLQRRLKARSRNGG